MITKECAIMNSYTDDYRTTDCLLINRKVDLLLRKNPIYMPQYTLIPEIQ